MKAGLDVVLCDVDPETLDFKFAELEGLLDENVLCVVSTHLFGRPADIRRVKQLCARKGIFVVEDAAQAMGGQVGDRLLLHATAYRVVRKPIGLLNVAGYFDGLITLVDSSAGMRAVAERKIAAANASDVRVVDLDLMRDAVPAERYDLFERGVLRPALTAAGFVDVGIDDCFVVEKGPRRYPVFLATARKP